MAPMIEISKRVSRLSDGRELIYFDDSDTSLDPERAQDTRLPDPRPVTASMRQDPLTGEWVSIASARQNRAFLPDRDPLAPSTPGHLTEVPNDDYDVVVFENKSPSFGPDLPGPDDDRGDLSTVGLGRSRPAYGRCEVVCFGPERDGSFATLTRSRARTVIEALADRTAELSALPGVRQVFPFENRGEQIGVTLHHPHGQIYAYPYITPRTQRLLSSIHTYGPNLFGDLLAYERTAGRVILAGEHFTAFVPFAARWPIEIHLLPHRHIPDLAATRAEERDELAVICGRLLRAIDLLYDHPVPYIAAWHQAPVSQGRGEVRLMWQITSPQRAADRLKYLAGSEAAMGAFIGDIEPEAGAARLRDALAQSDG